MARVYWNHWRKDHRLFLLDAAEDAIKPIEYSINKAEMIRMVKRGPTKPNEGDVEAAEQGGGPRSPRTR